MRSDDLRRVFDQVRLGPDRQEALLDELLAEEERMEIHIMENNNMTEMKKRRFSPRTLAAIAVAAAVLCGSALAVGHSLGAGDWFRGFFAQDSGELTDGQVETLNEIGQTFEGPDGTTPAAVTSNGATITPLAALADENVYYLRLRIEAPEGTVLPDLDGDVDGYYQLSSYTAEERLRLEFEEGAYESYGYSFQSFWMPDANLTDNVKEVVVRILAQEGTDLNFLDGTSKRLTIHGLWVQSPYKEYTPIFTGDFAFDIGQSFESKTLSLDCGGATYCEETYGFTNILDRVELSPLGMTAYGRSTLAENDWVVPGVGPIKIMLKDGTEFWPQETVGHTEERHPNFDEESVKNEFVTDFAYSFVFDEPLDLDQVDYLRYGDNVIPVAQGQE